MIGDGLLYGYPNDHHYCDRLVDGLFGSQCRARHAGEDGRASQTAVDGLSFRIVPRGNAANRLFGRLHFCGVL